MEQEKLDQLVAKLDSKVANASNEVKAEISGLIEEAKNSAIADSKELIVKLEGRLSTLETAEAKNAKMKNEGNAKSFEDCLTKAWEQNKDRIKQVAEGELQNVKLEIKAAGNMLQSTNVTDDVPQADRLAGFGTIPSRQVRLLDVMTQRGTTSDKVDWVYQANKDGSAGQTAEGDVKNQIDFDFEVAVEPVKKTTAFIKVSDEMLADNPFASGAINDELRKELLKAVESGAYSGNGTGANLRGIKTVASAFSADASLANDVDEANEVDVLVSAALQIELAQEGDAAPNYIFVHPSLLAKLKTIKLSSTDKRYVDRLMMVGQTLLMDGIPIIKSTLIPRGEYLIGDFSKALLVQREGLRIDIGFDADDFTKNLRTIRAEWRGAVVVKNNDRSAFVAGIFADDIADLETP